MSQKFENAKIYKITNDYNDQVYIGSTCNTLVRRFSVHRCDARKECTKERMLYKLMNEIGYERFRIELIEIFPCEDKYQLLQKEGEYIRTMGSLNMKISGRTDKEYSDENREKINQKHKEYKLLNPEKIKKYNDEHKQEISNYHKEYRIKNKDELTQRSNEYREKNADIIKQKKKEYYEKNKETINEKLKIKYLNTKLTNTQNDIKIAF